ncbi:MAG: glycosyltransferase [Ignavibacteriaceae bacterium]
MTAITIILIFLLVYYILFLSGVNHGIRKVFADRKNFRSKYYPLVSVIIPFRNESAVILNSLESIRKIDYPDDKLEVVYVDDNSDDDGYEKLKNAIRGGNIKLIRTDSSGGGRGEKKRAIQTGIKCSSGEIIFTTDADCTHGKEWLRSMVSKFEENVGFVSGPVAYEEGKNFFARIQQMEFAGLVLIGAGLIGIKRPLLCNGANIAYRREAFESVGGFEGNLDISSGDDEFLMQKIASGGEYNVKFCFENSALVLTKSCKTLGEFAMQRRRWSSKGLFYKEKTKVLGLVLIYLFYISFPVMLILGISTDYFYLRLFWFAIILKSAFEFGILKNGEILFQHKVRKKLFAGAQFLHIPYIIIIPLLGLFGNYVWKERKLKR